MRRHQDKQRLEHICRNSQLKSYALRTGAGPLATKADRLQSIDPEFFSYFIGQNDESTSGQALAGAYLPQFCTKSPMQCVFGQDGWRAKLMGCSRLTLIFLFVWDTNDESISGKASAGAFAAFLR